MSILKEGCPKILIISDSALTTQQGTGVCLLKHFNAYPTASLYSAYLDDSEHYQTLKNSCHFDLKEPFPWLWRPTRLISRRLRVLIRFILLKTKWQKQIENIGKGFKPDFIYIVPYSENCLYLASLAIAAYPSVPYGIHLFDWLPRTSSSEAFRLLKSLSHTASFRWALGSSLASAASKWSESDFEVVPIFYGNCASKPACKVWQASDKPTACILGNVWSKSALNRILDAWELVLSKHPEWGPIQWIASDWTIQRGWSEFLNETRSKRLIKHVGFIPNEEFQSKLQSFRLSFIPFSTAEDSGTSYSKYSIPSKITELACHGIPFVAVAEKCSGLGVYLEETNLGDVASADSEELVNRILELLSNLEAASNLSISLWSYASKNFRLSDYQEFLYQEIFKDISDKD